jgi:putative membrane protein
MQRRNIDYLLITLKGIAMGAADAVPGVSGGTIAFISGIYEELIDTISNINLSLLKTLRNDGLASFWSALNGNFLTALLFGIVISFVSFMRLAKYLIEYHPVLIWSFFFGLIIASIYFVGRQIKKWQIGTVLALILGAAIAFSISLLPSSANNEHPLFLFVSGALAICAMILPGISGSFILVILGAYKTLSDAFHDFDIKRIFIFATGALVGLLSFSHVLKWLFKHYNNVTLAVLTGFIFGSLNKVWPWKITEMVMDKATGNVIPMADISDLGNLALYQQQIKDFESLKVVTEKSVSAFNYSQLNNNIDSQLIPAILLMIAGFLTIFILEKLGNQKTNAKH